MAEINENEIISELDESTQNRIDLAWKCILDQFFDISKTNSQKEGPGVNIFKFLRTPKNDKSNCEYLYAEKDGLLWKDIISFSPYGETIQTVYDSINMVAICVHIPLSVNIDKTVGNIKLFNIETKEEINIESKEEINIESKEEINIETKEEYVNIESKEEIN
jgi:hypothetical protein